MKTRFFNSDIMVDVAVFAVIVCAGGIGIREYKSAKMQAAHWEAVADSLQKEMNYAEKKWEALEDISEHLMWDKCPRPPLVVTPSWLGNPALISLTGCDGKEVQFEIYWDGRWRESGLTWQH